MPQQLLHMYFLRIINGSHLLKQHLTHANNQIIMARISHRVLSILYQLVLYVFLSCGNT
jgi:hypothetical protein